MVIAHYLYGIAYGIILLINHGVQNITYRLRILSTSAMFDREIATLNPNIKIAVIESKNLEFSLTEVWQAYVEEFINHSTISGKP